MNIYDELNKLEQLNGNTEKEEQLEFILRKFKNAEKFFKFTFSEDKFGVQEKTFKNIFGEHNFNHISDYLETLDTELEKKLNVEQLIAFGPLLLRFRGHDQQEQIKWFFKQLPGIQKKWFCRAILKDLRCGVQLKTFNKVCKILGLKPIEKFSMQLCDKVDIYDDKDVAKKLKFPLSMECKYDGIRMQAEIFTDTINDDPYDPTTETQVILTSRRGTDRTKDFPEIVRALKEKFSGEDIILDGELISSSFQELTRKDSISQKKFVIFDLLVDEELPYINRWDNLYNLCLAKGITQTNYNKNIKYINQTICLAEHYSADNIEEVRAYYEELNSRKEEGIIIKLDDRIYERNSRKHMFKCKKVYTADLLVVGFKYGEGKRTGKVSTLCLEDKSRSITVDVGSGIDDVTCELLTQAVIDAGTSAPPAFIGSIVEILFNEITETNSIRFPRFIKFRDDKDEADDLSEFEVRQ